MLLEMIFLFGPLLIGLVQTFAKFDAIDELTDNYHAWLVRSNRAHSNGKGTFDKIARQTLVPWNSLFLTIHDLTDSIRNWGLQSGIRLASYIYLYAFLLLILVTIGKGLFILALIGNAVFALLFLLRKASGKSSLQHKGDTKVKIRLDNDEKSSNFITKYYPFFVSENNKTKVRQLLDVERVEVDYKGKIYTDGSQYLGKTMVGYVDNAGNIYDMRERKPLKVGMIDTSGCITSAGEKHRLLEGRF
jgi:hypothetical protein